MNFKQLEDFASESNQEIGNFRLEFILSPNKMRLGDYEIDELNWDSIHFGKADEVKKIPNDKRGVYALIIGHPSKVLPPHGYVIYIGIAGRRSNRSLRQRYKDYLQENTLLNKRPKIAHAIGNWSHVLRFYFAPVDNSLSPENLEKLEEQINTALIPPYSTADLEAVTKRRRRAFVR